MRPAIIAFLLMGFIPATAAPAPETPLHVTTCELQRHPGQFEGKLVELRGIVTRGFEDFTVRDPDTPPFSEPCGTPVWLERGGDGKGPRAYMVVHPAWPIDDVREWAQQARIDSVRFIHDEQYREMDDRLRAFRHREPDGSSCMGLQICSLYRVTATITGRFFAGHQEKLSDGHLFFHGYGHMGCCHLLIMQQVSNVVAERTAVPEDGEFSCSTQSWTPTAEELAELQKTQSCSDWLCRRLQYYSRVAAHWGDAIDFQKGWEIVAFEGWTSADLLLRYTVIQEPTKKKHAHSSTPPGSVRFDRIVCKPISSAGTATTN